MRKLLIVAMFFVAGVVCSTQNAQAVVVPIVGTLLHHWDAFDPAGTGIQPASGPIAMLVDLAGTNDASVSYGTPIYNSGDGSTIGGLPTVRFTTADGLKSMNPIADQTVTIFSVSQLNPGTHRRLITGTGNNYLLGYHGNSENQGFNGNWFGDNITTATTNPHMYIHRANNDTSDDLYDGSTLIPGNRGPGAGTPISHVGFGGRNWNLNEASDGDISEILIFDSDMSQNDFDAVGLYLAQKYGFQAFGHDGTVLGGGLSGSSVPEPTTLTLGALALFGLGTRGRRQRA